jgi:hypothetical protein
VFLATDGEDTIASMVTGTLGPQGSKLAAPPPPFPRPTHTHMPVVLQPAVCHHLGFWVPVICGKSCTSDSFEPMQYTKTHQPSLPPPCHACVCLQAAVDQELLMSSGCQAARP